MKMIKNFKIALRQGYVFRDLKKRKIDITEEELSVKIKEIQKILKPATVYDTFNPAVLGKKIDFGKSIAVTLFAVTLGSEVEALENNEILCTALKDGLEVAKNFVLKLINLEAEEEHCELMESSFVAPSFIFENKKILSKMDFSKIAVKFDAGVLSPLNTGFAVVGWLLKKRK